jgi:type I restriction enzyme R subunit
MGTLGSLGRSATSALYVSFNLGKRTLILNEGETPKLEPIAEAGSGRVQEKEKIRMGEIIEKLNDLFGSDTTQDQLVYVNHVIKGKLLESEVLIQQAASNSKEQFAASPDIDRELANAIIEALDAHNAMSTKALNSESVKRGIKDILLNHTALWELLREKAA